MTDLMEGHCVHGLLVELLALRVVHRQHDVGVGDGEVIIVCPTRPPTDRLGEAVYPAYMDVRARRVVDEGKADRKLERIPRAKRLPNARHVGGSEITNA